MPPLPGWTAIADEVTYWYLGLVTEGERRAARDGLVALAAELDLPLQKSSVS